MYTYSGSRFYVSSYCYVAKASNAQVDENEDKSASASNTKSFDHEKTSPIISDENVESQYNKDVSIISIQNRSVQRSQSENTPLFHDSSSGRLVKLENFSFDSAPNHFLIQSEDYLECNKLEKARFHSGKMGDIRQGNKTKN